MPFQKIKQWIFNLFHFNKQERNGVFLLCSVLCVFVLLRLLLPLFADRNNKVELITFKAMDQQDVIDSLAGEKSLKEDKEPIYSKQTSPVRFVFNPNTISPENARLLGFSEKQATTLMRFRAKGGKFFKSEDLKKLYGLSPELYAALEPYVLIPTTKKTVQTNFKKDSVFARPWLTERKYSAKAPVEINSADSIAIVFLKGIGPGFTKRIMKYRALLGGFHSLNQLKEVWGMTDSTFMILSSQIVLNDQLITKIPINAIDLNSLKKHPYFNFQTAQALINYRNKHGRLTEADILNSGVLSSDKLKLILPYMNY